MAGFLIDEQDNKLDNSPDKAESKEDLDFIWEEYQKRIKDQQDWDENGLDVLPDPEFVIKGKLSDLKTKIFINILSNKHISEPVEEPIPDDPVNTRLRIPLSCDDPIDDQDKSTSGYF